VPLLQTRTVSFHELSWGARFKAGGMGDLAESVFEATYPQNWDRFGLDRATINLRNVPLVLRHKPDYITAKGLVEVQGFGRDQRFKLKNAKLEALLWWNDVFRTDLFVWDSHNSRYGWLRLAELLDALEHDGTDDAFDDGRNPYVWLHANDLPVVDGTWTAYQEEPNEVEVA
jgi:hypothetical protein